MQFYEWEPMYEKILEDMGYDSYEDENSTRILKAVTMNCDLILDDDLEKCVKNNVTIFGNSTTLDEDIEKCKIQGTVISSGSAVKKLLMRDIVPDIIVTDLDGDIESQIKSSILGSITLIHAHGDNYDLIMKYASKFKGPVMLTTQSKPETTVFNFGGFTDGDRAVCMARHFGAESILLMGFDFDNPNLEDCKNDLIKKRKLTWAKKIILNGANPKDILFP